MYFERKESIDPIQPDELEGLSFDDWKRLHEKDPALFNFYRKLMLEHQINQAPEDIQPRLRGLLFQLKGESARSRTALDYNLRLSEMMMELVEQLREQLQLISEAQRAVTVIEKPISPSAGIIPFRSSKKHQQH